jgi:DegV family protein with EDD domain
MKISLVTDSASDLPADLAEQYGIIVVPAILVIEGREYVDGVDITRDEFYHRLPALRVPPTTASPSIGAFQQAFQKHFDNGSEHIISIHTAGTLTSIVNIARQAAVDFASHITVVDTGQLTMGVGFQVLAAAEAILGGASLPEALAAIRETRKRIRVAGALDTMEYLRRSGRVPGPVAALGGLLSIKPIVEIREGAVKAIGAARTTRQAAERMMQFALGLGHLERLAILHINAEARARQFLQDWIAIAGQSLPREIRMYNLTSLIGTHLGPNAIGLAAVTASP